MGPSFISGYIVTSYSLLQGGGLPIFPVLGEASPANILYGLGRVSVNSDQQQVVVDR